MARAIVDTRDVLKRTTLNVEVRVVNMRWVKLRLWLAIQICRIAAKVGGIELKINQSVGVIVTHQPEMELEKR